MRKIEATMFSSKTRVGGGGTRIVAAFQLPPNRGGETHPWSAGAWFGEGTAGDRWAVTFDVGFVNGVDPMMPGAGEGGTDVEMWDQPTLVLAPEEFRLVGEAEAIPPYFKALGATALGSEYRVEGEEITADGTDRSETTESLPPRALRAIDFYVAMARATYHGEAVIVDASGASGKIVDYAVRYDTSRLDQVGTRARFLRAAKMPEPLRPTVLDHLLGDFQDEGEDRQLICTFYLLAPEGVTDGLPDGTWLPYFGWETFWNLDYAARNVPPATPPAPIRLFTGLAGGVGDLIGNQFLALTNDQLAIAENAINNTDNRGRFWTA